MTKNTGFVFKFLQVVAWIIFVGVCIETGALAVNFVYSLFNPLVLKNLYNKLDLSAMYEQSQFVFFLIYGFILSISLLKAFLFYDVIKLISKLDLQKPFSEFVSFQISRISKVTLSIGISSVIATEIVKTISQKGFDVNQLNEYWTDGEAFIFMAAIIFIIATIFKRGIELQSENDLTV
ncbi:MAG: hypothetical protein RJA53_293 [Bacteroidota bacterium]|jgi:hypothetical protein